MITHKYKSNWQQILDTNKKRLIDEYFLIDFEYIFQDTKCYIYLQEAAKYKPGL